MTELVRQSLRFSLVGLVNTAIGLMAIYALMFLLDVGPALANMAGYTVGLAVSFLLNRVWTFNNTQPLTHVLPKYLLTAAACYLLNLGAVVLCAVYLSTNPYLTQLLGIGIYTICMFLGCRGIVFASRRVTIQAPS